MRKLIKVCISLLLVISLFSACGVKKENVEKGPQNKVKSDKLQIYTTIYPLQFLTEQIGNGYVEVENITPPGTEAHSFDPTQKTVVKIAQSDMFIYSGTGMEGFADKIKQTVKKEKVSIVKAAEGIRLINAKTTGLHEGKQEKELDADPHVWLDPIRAIKMAENIKEALIQLKPDAKDDFEKNFNALKLKLESLDQEFRDVVTKAPKKTFVVSHSAYGYWEDVYGLKQIGISGLSPTNEPSSQKLKEIIELAKENNISYVLFEPNLSNKVASVVKREVGADSLTLHNLESLTANEIQNKDDYLSVMKSNILSLQKALQ
ncbi:MULTISPECIES: metal ABC transporter substrate-binding protein [Bacillus cereus group]|uniref:metal ABC transporter substrate-binding protein n=1 Tax=Bacillus cereus group TaxID=86661 RepID=UPI000BEB6149|nr:MULTISPECIES: metal ABC transporter substrate-binding protein [Bacillus cereus group]PEF50484.1 adhesin [Bacillus thuringiensis]PFO91821.1 adhesin [Bacillus cereus]